MTRIATVTQGGWSVGSTSPAEGPDGQIGCRLSLFRLEVGGRRLEAPYRPLRAEADRAWFPSHEAAAAYCLERGYTQPYRRPSACDPCRSCGRRGDTRVGGRCGPCSAPARLAQAAAAVEYRGAEIEAARKEALQAARAAARGHGTEADWLRAQARLGRAMEAGARARQAWWAQARQPVGARTWFAAAEGRL